MNANNTTFSTTCKITGGDGVKSGFRATFHGTVKSSSNGPDLFQVKNISTSPMFDNSSIGCKGSKLAKIRFFSCFSRIFFYKSVV